VFYKLRKKKKKVEPNIRNLQKTAKRLAKNPQAFVFTQILKNKK